MSSNNDDTTSCTASNCPPDGPAVGADGDRSDRSNRVGRRSFVKGLGASTVGALGFATGTDSADAFVISGSTALALGGLAVSAAGGAGVAYLARNKIEGILGQGENLSGYTGKDALMTQIFAQAKNMKTVDERVMTSIENNLANSETIAFAKGKAAALEKMNAEAPEAEAVTAMEEAVGGYYATVQTNIAEHLDQKIRQIDHHLTMVDAHANLSLSSRYKARLPYNTGYGEFSWGGYSLQTDHSVTLTNGEELTGLRGLSFSQPGFDSDTQIRLDESTNSQMAARLQSYGDNSAFEYISAKRTTEAFRSAASRSSTVKTKLEGFVTDLYAEYGAGDIPTEDVIDPITAATQMGQNTGMAGQAAEAAMLGIPTSASFSLWLELQDADGNTTEVEAEMYTTASPTDGSGNETGWEVGTTYDPANFDPPIYIAYEYIDPESGEKSSDFIELDHPFTVIEATDAEGNEVTNVQNEERITQTADVTKLEEELAQLRDEQQRLQEEAQSGGGFSLDSLSMFGLPGEAVALGGAAVVSFFALGD